MYYRVIDMMNERDARGLDVARPAVVMVPSVQTRT